MGSSPGSRTTVGIASLSPGLESMQPHQAWRTRGRIPISRTRAVLSSFADGARRGTAGREPTRLNQSLVAWKQQRLKFSGRTPRSPAAALARTCSGEFPTRISVLLAARRRAPIAAAQAGSRVMVMMVMMMVVVMAVMGGGRRHTRQHQNSHSNRNKPAHT
jgi:hypothetical protein